MRSWRRTGRAILERSCVVALLALVGGCSFEERGNGDEVPEVSTLPIEGLPIATAPNPTAAALAVVRTFRDATAVGDLSLALALMDRDASFADDLVGPIAEGTTRGELLLELRSRLAGGLGLREDSAEVIFPEGVAVVFSRLTLEGSDRLSGDDTALAGRAVEETVVLVPGEEGWRIRHLHRSIPPSR